MWDLHTSLRFCKKAHIYYHFEFSRWPFYSCCKPRGNIIARELALEFGDSAFRPRVVIHKPGITNVTCDALSRLYMPQPKLKPKWLDKVEETTVPTRTDDYFLALLPPTLQ